MAGIRTEGSRLEIARDGERVRVTLRPRRRWPLLAFLAAWIGGWVIGEGAAIEALRLGAPGEGTAFLALWLTAWTAGGAFAWAALLWGLAGREVLTLDRRALAVRHAVAGLGRTRAFDLASISGVRVEPGASRRRGPFRTPVPTLWQGPVAFDHGGRTYQVGQSLAGQDAEILVDLIRQRVPEKAARGW